MLQRFIGHDRPEIRATDTDVDDVANALARVTFPRTAADAVGKIGHLVEDGMDFWHNVLTIDHDRCAFRCAQRHVQHGAVFRNVDLVTPEHGVDPLTQSRLVCQLHEELQSLIRNAILRVIQK